MNDVPAVLHNCHQQQCPRFICSKADLIGSAAGASTSQMTATEALRLHQQEQHYLQSRPAANLNSLSGLQARQQVKG